MHVRHLKLTHFRNQAALNLQIPQAPATIALIGPNGSGKTSVLEALSLLTPTRGLLGAEGKSQITHGKREWGIWAQTEHHEIGQSFSKGERHLKIDAHKQPLEKLAHLGSVVWLTPQTDFLFSGPPASRRRWLDDIATALIPTHAGATARYRQHRTARLKLLVAGKGGDWLDAEEQFAAQWGITVLQNRLSYLNSLKPSLQNLATWLPGYLATENPGIPPLELQLSGSALEVMESPNPIAALKGKFERSREIDARLERTHAGPNTLDLTGTLHLTDASGAESRVSLAQASSGQHKRGLLFWLAAHIALLKNNLQKPPLVLIDEFSAHLDAEGRSTLLNLLTTSGCQTWLTDVEPPAQTAHLLHFITLPQ
jgi:DNA replication and repair protein RecF